MAVGVSGGAWGAQLWEWAAGHGMGSRAGKEEPAGQRHQELRAPFTVLIG